MSVSDRTLLRWPRSSGGSLRSLTASITAERRSLSFLAVLGLPEDEDDDDDDDDEEEEEEENVAVKTKRERESIVIDLPRRRQVAMFISYTTPPYLTSSLFSTYATLLN